jgi:hypothetical protein
MRGFHLEQGTYIPHIQNRSYKLQEQTHKAITTPPDKAMNSIDTRPNDSQPG